MALIAAAVCPVLASSGLATTLDAVAPLTGPQLDSLRTTEQMRLPAPLSQADSARYRRIFALQKDGRWAEAATLIRQLDDDLLLGHVQAQKYLHPTKYRSRYPELLAWTQRHADHPQAARIYRLAARRQLDGWKPPSPPVGRMLLGNGASPERRRPAAYESPRKRSAATRQAVRDVKKRIRSLIRARTPARAYRLLRTQKFQRLLDPVERALMSADIAHAYFVFGNDGMALKLAQKSIRQSARTVGTAAWAGGLAAWRLGRMTAAGTLFETLADSPEATPAKRAAAAYWAARVQLAAGRTRDARTWLHQAMATPGTLYGILARHSLKLDLSLGSELPSLTRSATERLFETPGGQRAFALLQAGQNSRAEREFRKLYPSLPDGLRPAVMTIAARHGMPSLSMRIAGILEAEGQPSYFAALFPLPAWTVPAGAGIDPALIYSIVRKESNFDPRARSKQGALGLMQLMPRTARAVDRTGLLGRGIRDALYDPAINVTLGGRYVRQLFGTEDVQDDLFKMLAAYNAGRSKLRRWMERVEYRDDPLLFIESIPSPETRSFLEDTTRNLWIYRLRLGQPTPSLTRIAAGNWPLYVAAVESKLQGGAHARN